MKACLLIPHIVLVEEHRLNEQPYLPADDTLAAVKAYCPLPSYVGEVPSVTCWLCSPGFWQKPTACALRDAVKAYTGPCKGAV
jgi:hypothetical protein